MSTFYFQRIRFWPEIIVFRHTASLVGRVVSGVFVTPLRLVPDDLCNEAYGGSSASLPDVEPNLAVGFPGGVVHSEKKISRAFSSSTISVGFEL